MRTIQTTLVAVVAAGLGWAAVAPAMAATVDLSPAGGSFEEPDVPNDAVEFDNFGPANAAWFRGADVGIQNQFNFGGPAAADGSQYVFLGNGANFTNIGTDRVGVGIGTPDVLSYTLTVAVARRNLPGPEVDNLDGLFTLGIQDLTGVEAIQTLVTPRAALSLSAFQDFSVTLPAATVAAGDSIRLFLDKNSGFLIVADDFRLVANVVPEPAALGLLAPAALGLLGRRRRG